MTGPLVVLAADLAEATAEFQSALEPIMDALPVVFFLLIAYFIFYRSALVFLWFKPLSPILHRLGFRVVTWDMSFHIYVIRWRREWMYL
jgi:hypothetical protein